MRIFSETNTCIKCGGAANITHDNNTDTIKRTCKTCGFTWEEKPLDDNTVNKKESIQEDDRDLLLG